MFKSISSLSNFDKFGKAEIFERTEVCEQHKLTSVIKYTKSPLSGNNVEWGGCYKCETEKRTNEALAHVLKLRDESKSTNDFIYDEKLNKSNRNFK